MRTGFFYEVEIVGGITVTGEATAEEGYLTQFSLPDETLVDCGFQATTLHSGDAYRVAKLQPIAQLIRAEIERLYVDELAESVGPDADGDADYRNRLRYEAA